VSATSKTASSHLPDIVGAEHVSTDPAELGACAVDGRLPSVTVCPGSTEEVIEVVKYAAAEKLALIASGARTKLGIGSPPTRYDVALDMTRLNRIIAYDPGDLTLSVETGTPLRKVAEALAQHRQFLPLAVPFFDRATVVARLLRALILLCGSFTAQRGIMSWGWSLFWGKASARKAAATW